MTPAETPVFYATHPTAIGTLLLAGGARGLRYLGLLADSESPETVLAKHFAYPLPQALPGFFDSTGAAIDRYLNGKGALQLPYSLIGGTPLQRAVWLAIAKIPYGETISYTTLAERVGFPRAVRAIASACGANPLPLVIACHRVVGKDGGLGGFSLGGAAVKERLLQIESANMAATAA